MEKNFKDIQWVVQRNLTSQSDLLALKEACEKTGVDFIELEIIPFSDQLPEFDRSKRSILYGSTTFNELAYREPALRPGLFFYPEHFSIENYFDKWGRRMLNFEASVTTFNQLIKKEYPADKLLFIRPDEDNKSFAGEVRRFDEIEEWYEQLKELESARLSSDTRIIVSEPYNLQYEWRLWIVNGKMVAASKYREYFKLTKEEGCPAEVAAFAEARCREYTPHDVFVMDICLCGDEYFIVECGCMNAAGFYHARIIDIVKAVTEFFASAGA
ncbi:MAG: ATP-grasp domain-containing protein [Pseudobacter sp.]|uniref:ATP-grasp domain-containing protein n=1 Tax=Pseudobacter sp. TaxID=2045420 RepID=UPI003F7EC737